MNWAGSLWCDTPAIFACESLQTLWPSLPSSIVISYSYHQHYYCYYYFLSSRDPLRTIIPKHRHWRQVRRAWDVDRLRGPGPTFLTLLHYRGGWDTLAHLCRQVWKLSYIKLESLFYYLWVINNPYFHAVTKSLMSTRPCLSISDPWSTMTEKYGMEYFKSKIIWERTYSHRLLSCELFIVR